MPNLGRLLPEYQELMDNGLDRLEAAYEDINAQAYTADRYASDMMAGWLDLVRATTLPMRLLEQDRPAPTFKFEVVAGTPDGDPTLSKVVRISRIDPATVLGATPLIPVPPPGAPIGAVAVALANGRLVTVTLSGIAAAGAGDYGCQVQTPAAQVVVSVELRII